MRRLPEVMEGAASQYERADVREFARLASVQEGECYELTAEGIRNKFPRLEETIQSAGKCNYRKIGMAFCVGLEQEARMLTDIFSAKGFEMVSVNCKVGAIPTLKEWSFRQTRGGSASVLSSNVTETQGDARSTRHPVWGLSGGRQQRKPTRPARESPP